MRDLFKYVVTVGVSLHGNKKMHNMLSGNVDCFDTILSIPTKSCNKKVMKILMNIDGQRTGTELSELHKNKEKAKELLVALSLDGLIVTEK